MRIYNREEMILAGKFRIKEEGIRSISLVFEFHDRFTGFTEEMVNNAIIEQMSWIKGDTTKPLYHYHEIPTAMRASLLREIRKDGGRLKYRFTPHHRKTNLPLLIGFFKDKRLQPNDYLMAGTITPRSQKREPIGNDETRTAVEETPIVDDSTGEVIGVVSSTINRF